MMAIEAYGDSAALAKFVSSLISQLTPDRTGISAARQKNDNPRKIDFMGLEVYLGSNA